MKLLIFYLPFFFYTYAFPQSPAIVWAKNMGGTSHDHILSGAQTPDGGFVFSGSSNSDDFYVHEIYNSTNYWVVKLTSGGDTIWTRCYGGNISDVGSYIDNDYNGGFYIAGYTQSNDGCFHGNHGSSDIGLLRVNANGDTIWTRCIGGSGFEEPAFVKATPDGGCIMTGYSESSDGDIPVNKGDDDLFVCKLDSLGNIEWLKSYGGTLVDRGKSVICTDDGNYLVVGYARSHDGDVQGNHTMLATDCWILKLDQSGDTIWTKCVGGTSNDWAFSADQKPNGGYIICGESASDDEDVPENFGLEDFFVFHLDSVGNLTSARSYGGPGYDNARSIKLTSDGGCIIAGTTDSPGGHIVGFHGDIDIWVLKLNVFGDIEWSKCYGGTEHDYTYAICQTTDNGYFIPATSESVNGDITTYYGGNDAFLIRLEGDGTIIGKSPFESVRIYPNPAKEEIYICIPYSSQAMQIELLNLNGLSLLKKQIFSNQTVIDVSAYLPGMYFLRIVTEYETMVKKVVVE